MTLKDHFERIRWVFKFSQTDLGAIEKRTWKSFKAQLYDFFTEDIRWTFGLKPRAMTNADIIMLGHRISESTPPKEAKHVMGSDCVLALSSKDRAAWIAEVRIQDGLEIQDGLRRCLDAIQTRDDDFDGFLHFDLYYYSLFDDLGDLGPLAANRLLLYLIATNVNRRQIQTCPECKKMFLAMRQPRKGRLNHCSLACAQNYASREYRKRQGEKLRAKERERSHQRYVTKQRRQVGPNVKVARRPREG